MRQRERAAFTLVELLLAIVIALLVVALLFSGYHTVLTTTRTQAVRRAQSEAARAVSQLTRELQAAFLPADDTHCVFRLAQTDGVRLEWCATLLGAREGEIRWFDVTRLRYQSVTNGSMVSLVRDAAPLIGPAALQPPVTNELVRSVRQLEIRLFDGEAWHDTWPVSDPPALPWAADIRLLAGPANAPIEIHTEVIIPPGSRVAPQPTAGGQ